MRSCLQDEGPSRNFTWSIGNKTIALDVVLQPVTHKWVMQGICSSMSEEMLKN
jgi:hypothetical protein